MNVKHWKLKINCWAAKYHLLCSLLLFFLIAVRIFFSVPGITENIGGGALFFIVLVFWLTNIGWYYTWYRYLVYFLSWIYSLVGRLKKHRWFRIVAFIFLFLAINVVRHWIITAVYDPGPGIHEIAMEMFSASHQFAKILEFKSMLVTLGIMAVIWYINQRLFKKKDKTMQIEGFINHTGKTELDRPVGSIGALLFNEIKRRTEMLKKIDQIAPEPSRKSFEPTILLEDSGKAFEGLMQPDSDLKIGRYFEIPTRVIMDMLSWASGRPRLRGGLHINGERLILTAHLKGGGYNESLAVNSDDLENPTPHIPMTDTEKITRLTQQMVCRLVTAFVKTGSPKWRAVKYYSEGLKNYRDSRKSGKDKKILKLLEAKKYFKKALKEDNEFAQCYHNLGIIYDELDSYDAASASFAKALRENSESFNCFYSAALHHYKAKNGIENDNFKDARWHCEQALEISPQNCRAWNLLGAINYYECERDQKCEDKFDDFTQPLDVKKEIIRYFQNAVKHSWKDLCRARKENRVTRRIKNDAVLCLGNLGEIKGMKGDRLYSAIFGQSIFLTPHNSDLYLPWGECLYRNAKKKQAFKVFRRVFEGYHAISQPLRFWACYSDACKELYLQSKGEKKEYYKSALKNCWKYFLDEIAQMFQCYLDNPDKKDIDDLDCFRGRNFNKILELMQSVKQELTAKNGKNSKVKSKSRPARKSGDKFTGLNNPRILDELNEPQWKETQLKIARARHYLETYNKMIKYYHNIFREYRAPLLEVLGRSKNDLEEAMEFLKAQFPRQIKTLRLEKYLTQAYCHLGDLNKALVHAWEAIRLNPFEAEERHLLGKIYLAQGLHKEAVEALEKSLHLQPIHSQGALHDLARAYQKAAENAGSATERKGILQGAVDFLNDLNPIIERNTYKNKNELKEHKKSLYYFHSDLGEFYLELLQFEKAVTHFNKAQKMGYKEPELYLKLGWTHLELGFVNKASAFFGAAGPDGVEPTDEAAIGLLICRYLGGETHDLKKGLTEPMNNIRERLKENPNENRHGDIPNHMKEKRLLARCHQYLGLAAFKKRNYFEAAKQLKKSVSFYANAGVYYSLAEVYWRMAMIQKGKGCRVNVYKARITCNHVSEYDWHKNYALRLGELTARLEDIEKSSVYKL